MMTSNHDHIDLFWKNKFAGDIQRLELLPIEFAGNKGIYESCARIRLEQKLATKLIDLSGNKDIALYVILLTTFFTALARYYDTHRLLIATFSGESDKDDSSGSLFLNRIDILEQDTFRDIFAQVKHEVASVQNQKPISISNFDDFPCHIGFKFNKINLLQHSQPNFRYLFTVEQVAGTSDIDFIFETSSIAESKPYMENFLNYWALTADWLLGHPDTIWTKLPLHTPDQQKWLATCSTGEVVDLPNHSPGELVSIQAKKTPNSIVYDSGEQTLSFRDLDEKSNQIGHYFADISPEPESKVVLLMEKSPEYIMSLVGVLKAGFTFIPLSEGVPAKRVLTILEDTQAQIVVVSTSILSYVDFDLLETCGGATRTVILAEDLHYLSGSLSTKALPINPPPDALAYIMYTSGTSGEPKGVMVEGRSLINTVYWFIKRYGVSSGTHILQLTEMTFDPSLEQIFCALFSGATLHPFDLRKSSGINEVLSFMKDFNINIINSTPWLLEEWSTTDIELPHLHTVICGGDRLSASLKNNIISKGVALHNHYGPTEATIDSLAWKCDGDNLIKIGTPVDNTQVYLLNSRLEMAPVGVHADIVIAGRGVARGYLNDAYLTSQQFKTIPSPVSGSPVKAYQTGDIGFRTEDGAIVFVGRKDRQIKIMSARVDLLEVENALLSLESVDQVVVTSQEVSVGEGKLIVAFVKLNSAILESEIKKELANVIAEYMIPSKIIAVDLIPLSEHGKVDVDTLLNSIELASFVEPQSEFEVEIAANWQEVLGLEEISVLSDFLEIGGNSISAARVIYQMNESFGVKLTLSEFFICSTISACAEKIETTLLDGVSAEQIDEILAEE